MSTAFVCLTVISVVGGILFCQFMFEIWEDKERESGIGEIFGIENGFK